MRVVIVVFAALLTLGLAAFGVVAAHRATAPTSPAVMVSQAAPSTPAVPVRAPIAAIAQAQAAETAQPTAATPTPAGPAAETPIRVAQNSPTPSQPAAAPTPSAAAAAPAPTPAPAPAKGITACDKPGAMGLTRVVEIDTTGGPGFGSAKNLIVLRVDVEKNLLYIKGAVPGARNTILKIVRSSFARAAAR